MTLSFLVATTAQLLILAIIIRAVLSWFPRAQAIAPVAVFLDQATDPILTPIRRRLPPVSGFDFSPIVAILLISVVRSVLLGLLAGH